MAKYNNRFASNDCADTAVNQYRHVPIVRCMRNIHCFMSNISYRSRKAIM